ncbi:MAG TPA: transcriptional repressor [Candidatus Limnocylindrales bacterium]
MRSSITTRETRPRRTVASLIANRPGHFTAADLLADAQHQEIRIGRATIFRTLDLLADQGALERLDLPTGEHAYVACEPQEHHHHVVCRRCGASVEVADSGLQSVVREIAAQSGYRVDGHRLELYGLCPTCASESVQ